MRNVVKCEVCNFQSYCITRGKYIPFFRRRYVFPARNTKLFHSTGKDGYSPTRYAGAAKTGTIRSERPTYFETTTIHPTVLNDPHPILNDPHPSKDSSFANTSVNSSSLQQFSVTSSPSFHGKTVLARNEGICLVVLSKSTIVCINM